MEKENRSSAEKTKEFVEKYWPVIVATGTVVGATVWLVARYIKEHKEKSIEVTNALTQIEDEALASQNETSIILETGSHLSKVAGQDISSAKEELAPHLDDNKAKSTLEVLDNLAAMNINGRSTSPKSR